MGKVAGGRDDTAQTFQIIVQVRATMNDMMMSVARGDVIVTRRLTPEAIVR